MRKEEIFCVVLLLLFVVNTGSCLPVLFETKVYPLPASEYVRIEFFQQIGNVEDVVVEVYDIDGEKVKQKIEYEKKTIINLKKEVQLKVSNLKAGVYFVQVKYQDYCFASKILVE